jgi:hypothetical protein
MAFLLLAAISKGNAQPSGYATTYWNAIDSGTSILIDSLTIHDEGHYVSNSNGRGELFDAIHFLKEQPDLRLEVDFIINTTYDTITHHGIRTRASSVIHDFMYFGLPQSRYAVKEIVIPDKPEDKGSAKRFVIGRFVEGDQASYLEVNSLDIESLIVGILTSSHSPTAYDTITSRQRLLLSAVSNKFSKDIYSSFQKNPSLLPDFVTLQEGKVDVLISPEVKFEDDDLVFPADTLLFTWPNSSLITNLDFPVLASQKMISSTQVASLTSLLGKDFKYEPQKTTSLPLKEKMVGATKKCFDALSRKLPVNYYINHLGGCNGHVFWQFDWSLFDTYVPRTITLDEDNQLVSIEFFDDDLSRQFIVYKYNDELALDVNYSSTTGNQQENNSPSILVPLSVFGILLIGWGMIKLLLPRAWPRYSSK